ncbi:hypothetical protein NDU88_001274 [Pleurodeles waltl]|uniref:Uncharacterized protein n=1 Tax=Pleurodeles waltl TaxID=8319 RepID=A0AAV7LKZ8_PLEWA|nr:hypothetical protein NDU88_001274 [Pleurodeles waltl]
MARASRLSVVVGLAQQPLANKSLGPVSYIYPGRAADRELDWRCYSLGTLVPDLTSAVGPDVGRLERSPRLIGAGLVVRCGGRSFSRFRCLASRPGGVTQGRDMEHFGGGILAFLLWPDRRLTRAAAWGELRPGESCGLERAGGARAE